MSSDRKRFALRLLCTAWAAAAFAALTSAQPSLAQEAKPWWRIQARPAPTNLPPGGEAFMTITATNVGDAPTKGRLAVTDQLPGDVRLTYLHGNNWFQPQGHEEGTTGTMTCSPKKLGEKAGELISCESSEPLLPFESLEISVKVRVEEPSGTEKDVPNVATVSGGEAAEERSDSTPFHLSGAATSFGMERFELAPENEGGKPDTQAGSHPFQLTTLLSLRQTLEPKPLEVRKVLPSAPALFKDVVVRLPPGLVGNATVLPQCTDEEFSRESPSGAGNFCPASAAVGVAEVAINEPFTFGYKNIPVPVFNLVPAPGEPARFGFSALKVPVIFDTSVRTGQDYSAVVSVRNGSQAAQVLGSQVTFWGNPGETVHDNARGWACLAAGKADFEERPCLPPEPRTEKAFLSLPTSCPAAGSPALNASVFVDSWGPPRVSEEREVPVTPRENCGAVPFESSLALTPDTHAGNTPTGLTVVVQVPQGSTLSQTENSESAVRATTVTLPQGMLLSPSAANGLQACYLGEKAGPGPGEHEGIGFAGAGKFLSGAEEPTPETATFTSLLSGEHFCPDGAKIGSVRIKSPDLAHEVEGGTREINSEGKEVVKPGGVYLAEQNENPFGSLFAMYLVAEDPKSHVLVKLAGEVRPDPVTGQVTSTFKNTPPVPFERLELKLFGGPRASLTTPPLCGTYTTGSAFTPWSGGKVQTPSTAFGVSAGAEGTGCANPRPFAPSFDAHSTSTQAGAFTNFEVTIGRPDSQQALTNLTMRLPSGLAAVLKSVALCPEAQANEGTCGAGSLIGHVVATTGLGSDPFTVEGGQVFITGPYHGAPFGLSVVVPAKAPPFDFGKVVTRSTLSVDPFTAQATIGSLVPTMVNTNPTSGGTPTLLTGAPAQLKQLHVVVDRPSFQFNPTNCNPLKIESTFTGDQGGTAAAAAPFHVANCGALAFKPTFTASSEAHTSKEGGAALTVRVTSGGLGVEGIAKTRVELPLALPSRLTTIQKACLAKVFEANPESGCPEGSNIGTAIIHTPVFANALKGPAFLVSHGSEAFPDVEFVLKGEGVTIILDGKTDIKKGITKSSFEALPDAPFTEFETVLPEGPHSALAANRDLCSAPLIMPTTITSQDGRVIQQNTVVGVKGCKRVLGESNATKLAKALKKCRKQYKHNRRKRVACERRARLKYGPKKTSHKAHKH